MLRVLTILISIFCLSLSAPAAESQKRLGNGWVEYDEPHPIPDYFGWKKFFWATDHTYRLGEGYYRYFIDHQLAIGPLLESDPTVASEMANLIATYSADAQRSVERSRNELAASRRMIKRGIRSVSEHNAAEIALLKQEVRQVRLAREGLKRALIALDPEAAPRVWQRILDYVFECKATINIRRELTPHGDDVWEVFLTFEENKEKR